MSTIEHEERARLEQFQARLRRTLREVEARLQHYAADVREQKTYLWESRSDMDRLTLMHTARPTPFVSS